LSDASLAGQPETYVNVRGCDDLWKKGRLVVASLLTDRAISYSHGRGFEHSKVQPCAIHQKREHSATGFAGVMFSLDTKNGIRDVTVSGSKGNTGNIYEGRLKDERTEQNLGELPKVGTKIVINLRCPERLHLQAAAEQWHRPRSP
jgi:pyruvate,water dikinase